jgi:predicted  nucleic acid-binding Zn-ribbon protein
MEKSLEELRAELKNKMKEFYKLENDISALKYDIQEAEREEREREAEDRRNRWEMDQFTARQAAYHRR